MPPLGGTVHDFIYDLTDAGNRQDAVGFTIARRRHRFGRSVVERVLGVLGGLGAPLGAGLTGIAEVIAGHSADETLGSSGPGDRPRSPLSSAC